MQGATLLTLSGGQSINLLPPAPLAQLWEVPVRAPVFSSPCALDAGNATLALGAHDGQLHVLTLDRDDRSRVVHHAVPLGTASPSVPAFATPFAARSAGHPGYVAATTDGKLWHCVPSPHSDAWRGTLLGYGACAGQAQESLFLAQQLTRNVAVMPVHLVQRAPGPSVLVAGGGCTVGIAAGGGGRLPRQRRLLS